MTSTTPKSRATGTRLSSLIFSIVQPIYFGGEGLYTPNDGHFVDQLEAGFNLPNNIRGQLYGGAVH